jgi:hypothetical protein
MGHVYPESLCSRRDSSDNGSVVHPGEATRRGVIMRLGAVSLSPDHRRADVRVMTWSGELRGEVRVLRYRKVEQAWRLDSNSLLLQE